MEAFSKAREVCVVGLMVNASTLPRQLKALSSMLVPTR